MSYSIPFVIEKNLSGERSYDIYSRLLKDRVIFLTGEVYNDQISSIIAQMLFLDSLDVPQEDKTIHLYINSPGGVVTAGMALYDTMQILKSPVSTICLGEACSMGSLLLCSGTKGLRCALPHVRIMMHQPSGGFKGKSSDIEIQTKEILKLRGMLNGIYAKHTGKKLSVIEKIMRDDTYMSAQEALKFGLIDKILTNSEDRNE